MLISVGEKVVIPYFIMVVTFMRKGENYIYVKLMFCGLQMCGPGTAPALHKHIDLDLGRRWT